MRYSIPTLIAGVLAAAVACSSGGSPTPSPTPSPSPTPTTYQQVQQLAAAGLSQSYTGIYQLTATRPQGSARVYLARTPSAYRLDLLRGNSVSTLIHNARGTYSCQRVVRHRAKCLLVARAGRPVPALFDAGQKLWTDYLVELSRHAASYLVTVAGTTPATATLPGATCFAVAAGAVTVIDAGRRWDVLPDRRRHPDEGDSSHPARSSYGRLTRTAPTTKFLQPLTKPTPIPGLH